MQREATDVDGCIKCVEQTFYRVEIVAPILNYNVRIYVQKTLKRSI